jgi:hypothetical protein
VTSLAAYNWRNDNIAQVASTRKSNYIKQSCRDLLNESAHNNELPQNAIVLDTRTALRPITASIAIPITTETGGTKTKQK